MRDGLIFANSFGSNRVEAESDSLQLATRPPGRPNRPPTPPINPTPTKPYPLTPHSLTHDPLAPPPDPIWIGADRVGHRRADSAATLPAPHGVTRPSPAPTSSTPASHGSGRSSRRPDAPHLVARLRRTASPSTSSSPSSSPSPIALSPATHLDSETAADVHMFDYIGDDPSFLPEQPDVGAQEPDATVDDDDYYSGGAYYYVQPADDNQE
ncbi:vegetative cell wall protein gp1-like [Triticum urartu]|uniref:vegetative cell wall protein gp1-like n=1 Tax=Triticum urartu TaxID=4572 RepID=UPI002044A177|nr:vegetative cell wall protein gp1-like [Triticum urartu]